MSKLIVFAASPADVRPERDRLERVVAEINQWAPSVGYTLRLVRWEKDVRPGDGQDPQDVVDRQIGDADITVVVFWKRLGTPTTRAQSGTVAEFHRAVRRCREDRSKEIFVYFKNAPIFVHNDDLRQAQLVKKFRREIGATTLDWEFRSTKDFERSVRRHLTQAILARAPSPRQSATGTRQKARRDPTAAYAQGLRARNDDRTEEAIRWFESAALHDHVGGMVELGVMLREQGRLDDADEWFRRAADEGDVVAVYNVGLRLKERNERGPARRWLRRAAEGGDVAAMYNLGLLLKEDGEHEAAEPWLRRGAEGGDVAAMYNLGLLLKEDGEHEAAEPWLRRGAEGGDPQAMYQLALLLREVDRGEEADYWLCRSADAGDAAAIREREERD
jgi:TPR repeat protein